MNVSRIATTLCMGLIVSLSISCQKVPDSGSGVGTPANKKVGTSNSKQASDSPSNAKPTIALADYLPPLDEGRIEIAPPVDWKRLPRDSAFLVQFYKNDRNGLPRMEITVEDRSFGRVQTVTAENVEQFVKVIAADLESKETTPSEPVTAMIVGDVPCARYVTPIQIKRGNATTTADRQTLLVLHEGRLYTIHLIVLPGTMLRTRDAAYAVCSGLRFIEPESAGGADDNSTEGTAPVDTAAPTDDTAPADETAPAAKDAESNS